MTQPTPPADPAIDQLNFDQLAQLVNATSPDDFYRKADQFDEASNGLSDAGDRFRSQWRNLQDNNSGAAIDSGVESSERTLRHNERVLQATPGYGTLLRRAGDALANAQLRMRDLQQQRSEQAAASADQDPAATTPEDAAAAAEAQAAADEQQTEQARQIVRDLSTAYTDAGNGMSQLPEQEGSTGAADTGASTRSAPSESGPVGGTNSDAVQQDSYQGVPQSAATYGSGAGGVSAVGGGLRGGRGGAGGWQGTGRAAAAAGASPASGGQEQNTAPWGGFAGGGAPAAGGQLGGGRAGFGRRWPGGSPSGAQGPAPVLGRQQGAWMAASPRTRSAPAGGAGFAENRQKRPVTQSGNAGSAGEGRNESRPQTQSESRPEEIEQVLPVQQALPAVAAATASAMPGLVSGTTAAGGATPNAAPQVVPAAGSTPPGPNGPPGGTPPPPGGHPSLSGGRTPVTSLPTGLGTVSNVPSSGISRAPSPSALDLGQVSNPTPSSMGSVPGSRGTPVDLSMTASGQSMTPSGTAQPSPSANTGSSNAGHPVSPMMGAGLQQQDQHRSGKAVVPMEPGFWDEPDGVPASLGRPGPKAGPEESGSSELPTAEADEFLEKLRQMRNIR
ncbi:hypothetical protein [Saccharopolyspora sp. NPDC002686]|uniref:hypothetical protein n=1 Tax=Saccharopolyspora sp. NPDC002686 TaxID=3154541 RepID=UPI00331B198A